MAGGHMKYRTLSRSSSHRQALLRNLVTALIAHDRIHTTWHKAKEAQRVAEKLITLSKRNTQASRDRARGILFHLPTVNVMEKLFGEVRQRYETRPGGYTRVIRVEDGRDDGAKRAVLELVDSEGDVRLGLVARTIAFSRLKKQIKDEERGAGGVKDKDRKINMDGLNDVTMGNVIKATRFRKDGMVELERLVGEFEKMGWENDDSLKI